MLHFLKRGVFIMVLCSKKQQYIVYKPENMHSGSV